MTDRELIDTFGQSAKLAFEAAWAVQKGKQLEKADRLLLIKHGVFGYWPLVGLRTAFLLTNPPADLDAWVQAELTARQPIRQEKSRADNTARLLQLLSN